MLSGSITSTRNVRKRRVPIYSVVSLSALGTFASNIETYTHGQITRVAITEVTDISTGAEAATAQDYDGFYAVFRFRNTDSPWDYKEFHLADPIASIFEYDDAGKLVITETAGDQFATWYSTLTGKTYTFVKGWLWGG